MKKALILILAAAALVSCYRIETDRTSIWDLKYEASDSHVGFSWYSRKNIITKADTTYFVGDAVSTGVERHLNDGTSMGVFGYFHPQYQDGGGTTQTGGWNDGQNDNHPNLFYNEQVSIAYNGSTNKYAYSYSNDRFWPKNVHDRISFIAYYPWNALNTSGHASKDKIVEPFLDSGYQRQGMVGFYYTVHSDANDQVDFMVSDLCLDQSKTLWEETSHAQGLTIGSEASATADKIGTVKFFFHHALSQVRIKSINFDTGGNDDVKVTVNYIVFNNVAVFGQCIPVPDFSTTTATGRTTVTPTWPAGTLASSRPDYTSGVVARACYDADSDTWNINNFLLMIPHQFFPGATIEVNFDVKRKKDTATGEYYQYKNNTLTAPLTTSAIYGWEAGRIYTYNITLDLKQIKVNANVEPWLDAGDDVIMDK